MRRKNRSEKVTMIDWKSYKLQFIKDKTAKNLHHIIWKCNNKEYNTDNKENKVMVNEIWHDNFNRFVGNRQAPHLVLKYLLEDWWWNRVLSEWVKAELYWLLSLPREEFYKQELVKDKHKWKSLFNDDKIYKDTVW